MKSTTNSLPFFSSLLKIKFQSPFRHILQLRKVEGIPSAAPVPKNFIFIICLSISFGILICLSIFTSLKSLLVTDAVRLSKFRPVSFLSLAGATIKLIDFFIIPNGDTVSPHVFSAKIIYGLFRITYLSSMQ